MNEILEIKGKIYEVIDGQVTKIKVDETIFEIKSPEQRIKKEETTLHKAAIAADHLMKKPLEREELPPTKELKDRGTRVGIIKRCYIYDNILNDIKQGIAEGKKYSQLMEIAREYSPDATEGTLHWYVNMYKRFIREKESPDGKERGKVIGKLSNLYIGENVARDIHKGIKNGDDLIDIVKEYHPHVSSTTHKVYLSVYKRFLGQSRDYKTADDVKGELVARYLGTPIYKNVLDECKEEYSKGNLNFDDILRKYHSTLKDKSITRYSYSYRQHLGISLGKGTRIKKKTSFFRPAVPVIQKAKRKRRKRKPADSVGFCKTYKTWITEDEYQKVKKAVNSWNFIATKETIAAKIKLPEKRVLATLRYIEDKHEIYWKRNEDLIRVYHPCI